MPWALRTILYIGLAATPLILYVGFRCAASIANLHPAWKRTARRGVLVSLLWFLSLPMYTLVLSQIGRLARHFTLRPDLTWADYLLHYPFWFGVVVVLELTVTFVILDLGQWSLRLFPRIRERGKKLLAAARVGLAAAALVYVPVRSVLDTVVVRDTAVDVRLESLPPELEGFTMTLVSDIQVDRYTGTAKAGQVRRIVSERKPALLVSAGDLVTGGTMFLDEASQVIGELHGAVRSIAVLGDHDQWSAPAAIRALHERHGWEFLDDRHMVIAHHGKSILVTGLTHIYSRRLRPEQLEAFLEAAPAADLRVLLVHQPAQEVVQAAARHGYHLVLAGHTHGGQIVAHPLGIPVTPSRFETPYYRGEFTAGSTIVVVTDGVGLTLAPIRYHAPAEVTTVILHSL